MSQNSNWVITYGVYTTQIIRYHKNFIHAPIKTCPDYSVFWLLIKMASYRVKFKCGIELLYNCTILRSKITKK